MVDLVEPRYRLRVPVSRSMAYRLLSQVFVDPTRDQFEEFRNGNYLSELWDNLFDLIYMLPYLQEKVDLIGKIEKELHEVTFEEFAAEYARVFEVGVPFPPCPPLEGLQRPSPERESLLRQVRAFYMQFGLAPDGRNAPSKPADHLSVELEFLHFLAYKEAQVTSTPPGALLRGYVLAQRDFLQNHLIRWLPEFCEKLRSHCRISFFGDLTAVTRKFVSLDFDSLCSRLEVGL